MTKEEVYSQILSEHAKEPLISSVDATSKTEVLGAVYRAISAGISLLTQTITSFTNYFESTKNNAIPPSLAWLGYKASKYQHTDTLEYLNGVMSYASERTDLQIVKVSVTEQSNGQVYSKLATEDVDGNLVKLSAGELAGATSYIESHKPADMYLIVSSVNGDDLILAGTIYVDGIKINTLGQSIYDTDIYPVSDALIAYSKTYAYNNKHNSTVAIGDIESVIRSVSGVKNVVLTECAFQTSTSYDSMTTQTKKSLKPTAGYFVFDKSLSTLTYEI